jgi:hypothetical protein
MPDWKCKQCGKEKYKQDDLCKEHSWAGNVANVASPASSSEGKDPYKWSAPLLETFTGAAYWTERAALAKLMGITDLAHSSHGSNFKPTNEKRMSIILNLYAAMRKSHAAKENDSADAAIRTTYGYSPFLEKMI